MKLDLITFLFASGVEIGKHLQFARSACLPGSACLQQAAKARSDRMKCAAKTGHHTRIIPDLAARLSVQLE
jgi:hypothetical protein